MKIGDPVIARRGPSEPEFRARVVRCTGGRPPVDVEAADGDVIHGLWLVHLDDEALAVRRAALALDAPRGAVFAPIETNQREMSENVPSARVNSTENQ